jgi:hypothetical protein
LAEHAKDADIGVRELLCQLRTDGLGTFFV